MVLKETLLVLGLLAMTTLALLLLTFFRGTDINRARIFLRFKDFRRAFALLGSFVLITMGSHLAYIASVPGDQVRPLWGPGSPVFTVVIFMIYGSTIATSLLLYFMFRPVK